MIINLKNVTQPKILPKHVNIYEKTGFRYDNGRKECSTKWKRIKQWKMS